MCYLEIRTLQVATCSHWVWSFIFTLKCSQSFYETLWSIFIENWAFKTRFIFFQFDILPIHRLTWSTVLQNAGILSFIIGFSSTDFVSGEIFDNIKISCKLKLPMPRFARFYHGQFYTEAWKWQTPFSGTNSHSLKGKYIWQFQHYSSLFQVWLKLSI